MRPPVFRNDVPGLLPQLTQTVKDICDYLPSQRLTSNTLQLEEHRCGTIINVKDDTQPIIPAAGEVVAEDEDFFTSWNSCDIYDSYPQYGEKRVSQKLDANSGVFLEINKYTVNLNGIYANLDRKAWRVTDVASDFFSKYPALSATDESAIYGSLRLNFHITSGTPAPEVSSVFNYPPIYYTWNLSAEYDFEKLYRFARPNDSHYSYELPSKGNYENLTATGMPEDLNCIVGFFKLSDLKDFSDKWHAASGTLSGMSNPKMAAYCKTADPNPTIFMSFNDDLLEYVKKANQEESH